MTFACPFTNPYILIVIDVGDTIKKLIFDANFTGKMLRFHIGKQQTGEFERLSGQMPIERNVPMV